MGKAKNNLAMIIVGILVAILAALAVYQVYDKYFASHEVIPYTVGPTSSPHVIPPIMPPPK